MRRVIFSSGLIILFLVLGTIAAVLYAKGYRLNTDDTGKTRFVEGTGILVATSRPDGSSVYIGDELSTATNNTINLAPGEYQVRIERDGYFPWKKTIRVEKQVVSRADAVLFPTHPRLEPLTLTGANNPIIDPTGSFLAYTVSSSSAEKNGVYIINMNSRVILSIGGGATQIADDSVFPVSKAILRFSPDSSQLLAQIPRNIGDTISFTYFLLSANDFNQNPPAVTSQIDTIMAEWGAQEVLQEKKLVDSFPKELKPIIRNNFSRILLSPEENKVMYIASRSAALPIVKRLRVLSSSPETRSIEEGNAYVYDLKEDRNYLVFKKDDFGGTLPKITWHPGSAHLLYVKDQKVNVIEYDGKNNTTIYAGPFEDELVFPWSDGNSIVILTKLNNPDSTASLYRISLR